MTKQPGRSCGCDRHLAAALVLAAIVLITRAVLVAHYYSQTRDDNYHLYRGLMMLRLDWQHIHTGTKWNDPPFGEVLLAIPAWLNGVHMQDPLNARDITRDVPPPVQTQFVMPDSIRIETAIWQAILFLPALAVIFVWVRSIYSVRSAWLAMGMLLSEPTLAAVLPLPTPDATVAGAIVIACWGAWRYLAAPSVGRRFFAAAMVAVSLAMKNNALLLPAVVGVLAVIHWIALPLAQHQPIAWRRFVREFVLFSIISAVVLWLCVFCDMSAPDPARHRFASHFLQTLDKLPIPAGIYIRALATGVDHARNGHSAVLLGHYSDRGWWYYFPVVSTFKIPVGLWAVFLIGVFSLAWVKPRYAEIPLLMCAGVWTVSLMRQHINIGFRHFLIPEIFLLMLVSRCLAVRRPMVSALAWMGIAAAAIHVASFTPDYLSYVNFPRRQVYLQISDSNIDWGQATKQMRRWIDSRPDDGRPIYVGYFGPSEQDLFPLLGPRLSQYVMNGGVWVSRTGGGPQWGPTGLPPHGILIVSPTLVTGQYGDNARFAPLQPIVPEDVIGHCMLVYDLDALRGKLPIVAHQP